MSETTYSPKFMKAVNEVLAREGGYVNDSDDPGGETKYGISKRSYPEMDIKHITVNQAINIYFRDFWTPGRYGGIKDDELSTKMLSLAVTMGLKQAGKLLQRAVNHILTREPEKKLLEVDGFVGVKTLEAANALNPMTLLYAVEIEAVKYYCSLHKPKYIHGWINRALA